MQRQPWAFMTPGRTSRQGAAAAGQPWGRVEYAGQCCRSMLGSADAARLQVVTARTRVDNGLVFELTLKLGQGDQRVQLFRVRPRAAWAPRHMAQGRAARGTSMRSPPCVRPDPRAAPAPAAPGRGQAGQHVQLFQMRLTPRLAAGNRCMLIMHLHALLPHSMLAGSAWTFLFPSIACSHAVRAWNAGCWAVLKVSLSALLLRALGLHCLGHFRDHAHAVIRKGAPAGSADAGLACRQVEVSRDLKNNFRLLSTKAA